MHFLRICLYTELLGKATRNRYDHMIIHTRKHNLSFEIWTLGVIYLSVETPVHHFRFCPLRRIFRYLTA